MIIRSKGLDALDDKQLLFLSKFLTKSFNTTCANDLLTLMDQMEQYFFIKNKKPVAVVSFRKRGYLSCTNTYYTNVLYNVATAHYYRKRGYMKKLLKHIIKEKKTKRENKYLHLEVLKKNHKAIHLYKKLGFQVIYECMSSGKNLMRLDLQI